MEIKSTRTAVKSIEGRTVTGIASVFGVIDSYNDMVHRGTFKRTIQERKDRFRHMWQHDMESPPIAKITDIREVKRDDLPDEILKRVPQATGGLQVEREYLRTARGDEVLEGITSGAINEMSFAFDALKYDFEEINGEDGRSTLIRNLREARLWETSDVNWGANPFTVAASKSAIAFIDTGRLPLSAEWRTPVLSDFTDLDWEDLSHAEKERIAGHYAWIGMGDSFESLRFPHHHPSKNGIGKAVWTGVKSQMVELLQVPEADRSGVYEHLRQHYSSWEKTPPELEWFVLSDAIGKALKVCSVLNTRDLGSLSEVYRKLQEQLTNPVKSRETLTEQERRLLETRIYLANLEVR